MFTLGHGTIYYEDEFLLVINKPAGMLVHPTVKEDGGTLYNFVKRYYEANHIESGLHPVSRLDLPGLLFLPSSRAYSFCFRSSKW